MTDKTALDDISNITNGELPTTEQLQETDKTVGILVLVQGEKSDGSQFYAYVVIAPSKYQSFLQAEKIGNYNLEDYGEIVKISDGFEPPAEIRKEMHKKYGTDSNFIRNLEKQIIPPQ